MSGSNCEESDVNMQPPDKQSSPILKIDWRTTLLVWLIKLHCVATVVVLAEFALRSITSSGLSDYVPTAVPTPPGIALMVTPSVASLLALVAQRRVSNTKLLSLGFFGFLQCSGLLFIVSANLPVLPELSLLAFLLMLGAVAALPLWVGLSIVLSMRASRLLRELRRTTQEAGLT
ncbi:MAG: hypothetical protein AAF288_07395 [Planctomycetota bacterium]